MYDSAHLVRRSVAFAGDCQQSYANRVPLSSDDAEKFIREMAKRFQSPGAIILIGLTLVSFLLLLSGIEYAIRIVATNLAIVEHTESSGPIALSNEPDATLHKAPLLKDFDGEDQTLPVQEAALPTKPITAGLRSTMRHIHSQGGFFARFRGFHFGIFYVVVMAFFSIVFQALFSQIFGGFGHWVGSTFAALVCCNAHATWTHATIAAPSEKRFFERFLPRQVARQLILPTLRLHATIGMTEFVFLSLTRVAIDGTMRSSRPHVTANLGFLPLVAGIVMALGMILPSYIALIRTEASLLPEDMSAIVPFDRTFGGLFHESEETDTSSRRCAFVKKVTVRGAYMMFTRDTYKRTLKMLVKFGVISLVVNAFLVGIVAVEVFVIAGGSENVRKLVEILQGVRKGDY